MTEMNMVEDVPGRWDKFEIIRFVTPGTGALAANDPGLSGGIVALRNDFNAVVWANSAMATARWPYGTAALVPTDAQLTQHHQSPTHTRGRFDYILTPSGVTSACSRNDLAIYHAGPYIKFAEASNCYANPFGADGAVPSYETRIPSGVVPIKRVEMKWRDQGPHLICEWAVLKKVSPQYNLYYPQYEAYRDDTWDYDDRANLQTGVVYRYGTFPLPLPFTKTVRRMNAIRVNEVPSFIVIRCELAEVDRNRFDWMDTRAYISKIKFQLNEKPNLTSLVPDYVGYR